MADVRVDTSVWIDFFRKEGGRTGDTLDALLAGDPAVLCGVGEMEIFQGLEAGESGKVGSGLQAIRYVDTTREDFIDSGRLWRSLRQDASAQGVEGPSCPGCTASWDLPTVIQTLGGGGAAGPGRDSRAPVPVGFEAPGNPAS